MLFRSGSDDEIVSYYAHLFAGDATFALGRLTDARASYERALVRYPDAQAARLGLAGVLRAEGDQAGALAALLPTLEKPSPESRAGDDPWWNYYFGDAGNVDRLLGELRAPLRTRMP